MATACTEDNFRDGKTVVYAALGNENGQAFESWRFPDKTIQASGTGTVTVEGSANGSDWEPLKDQSGTLISLDASTHACALILENPRHMRAVNNNASGALIVVTCSK